MHRDKLLDACLGSSLAEKERKANLRQLLTGDLSQERIDVFLGAASQPCGRKDFSVKLARLLLPSPLKAFPRTRWLTSIVSLRQFGLVLPVHNLLCQAIPRWLGQSMQDKGVCRNSWDVPAEDSDAERTRRPEPHASDGDVGGRDWATYNSMLQGESLRFAQAQPGPHLLVSLLCLHPATRLMNHYEKVGSKAWDFRAMAQALRGGDEGLRILLAHEEKQG